MVLINLWLSKSVVKSDMLSSVTWIGRRILCTCFMYE